ncbi:alpha/beta hydrolase [Acinetobacter sp. ESL0695]|uniref:alpha/beta hydrolase n=1 Tax=Acinetobacter sp. ESL0695 TaxID=2983215 RepID=UPI0023F24159|nr:alpha/beta hydrolase [Acinetobacter sp. ESL0695]WEV49509.1 alpha/beta hydrolase [Acinetobacter sp. ESL0695]
MKNKKSIILIHGTWCNGNSWSSDFIEALESLGLTVYTPNLRYHDLPLVEGATKIASLSLTDYVNDLVALLRTFSEPVYILGHSLGGLIAQLLVAREPERCHGLILLGPAPMAGIYALYPTMIQAFYKHFIQWKFWKKPLMPNKTTLDRYCMNLQTQKVRDQFYNHLVAESGRAYAEMALWFFDAKKAAYVDTKVLFAPVLVISGSEDKVVVSSIAKATAKKYKHATYILLQGADHMYMMGHSLSKTISYIQTWLEQHRSIH